MLHKPLQKVLKELIYKLCCYLNTVEMGVRCEQGPFGSYCVTVSLL